MTAQRYEGEFFIPFPPRDVWPYLANTDSLNRAFGFPPVTYKPSVDADGLKILEAEARASGILLRWREYPFDWKQEERYAVRRVFLNGPFAEITGTVDLTAEGDGTKFRVVSDIHPRNVIGALLAKLSVGPQSINEFRKHCARVTEVLQGMRSDAFPRPGDPGPVRLDVLERGCQALSQKELPDALLARLRTHLTEAHDEDVTEMRPFALARVWGEERRDVLRMFLHATSEGLLDLSWKVLCPNCRVPKADFSTLRSLQAQAHCDTCEINFDVDFDRLVELRFGVSPQVRQASSRAFCIGGPQNAPHVVAQHVMQPGEEVRWTLPDLKDGLRLRARGVSGGTRLFQEPDAPEGNTATATIYKDACDPAIVTVRSTPATLVVRNAAKSPLTVLLEREAWPGDVASAAIISTMPEFRSLFSSEVLAPNLHVGIQSLAVLFTDLKGSTRFYQDLGDATAFAVVRDHFALLDDIVAKNSGTFVKTIGDAIMAVFMTAHDGTRAALEMRDAIAGWTDPRVPDPATFIKLGLHQGPVIAVNLNERLDYFGTTVNMAARVQSVSEGGEIVLTERVLADEAVASLLKEQQCEPQRFVATLSGFDQPVPLWRLPARQPAKVTP